jgi:hypothetical protein
MLPVISIAIICISCVLGGFMFPVLFFGLLMVPTFRESATLPVLVTTFLLYQTLMLIFGPPSKEDGRWKAVAWRVALIAVVTAVNSNYLKVASS